MTSELKERFALADEVGSPELWSEARRRAAAPERQLAGPDRVGSGPGGRRIMTAAVAFAVFAAAAVFAWELSHPDVVPKPPPVADEPVDLAAELGPGWTELPSPPEVRSGAATAWTGSQLLVWGGYVFGGSGDKPSTDDGFLFDAASRTWRSLPPSPLSGRSLAASAWTEREFLVWGGTDLNTYPYEGFVDGAAFDPVTGRWRSLPPAPIDGRAPMSVWTGDELIVWGTAVRVTPRPRDGAAYDPATNTWRRIADAPIELTDATAVWTGEEMIVFGAALDGNNHADTETAVGVAYDPASDTWRELPPSDFSPQAHSAAWPGSGEMIAWDYEQASAAYDPGTDRWRTLDRVPLRFYECYPESVAIDGYVFGNFCSQLALYSVADDRWTEITRERLQGWVIEPAAAGSAFLVMGHSLELSEEPDVTFDTRMLAWAPPDASETGGVEDPVPFVPPTEVVGDETQMPIVFPDGTQATVVYPTPLDLASLGVQPEVSYLWKDDPPPRYPIVFLHGADASIARYVDLDEGSRLVNTSEGGIEVFQARGNDIERRFWIRYELRSWTVLVSVRDALAGAVEVAASLDLQETESGFPVVTTSDPIALSHESGEGEGPMLAIGSVGDRAVLLWIERCSGGAGVDEVLESGAYGSACLADGQVTATIYGNPSAVEAIVQRLRIEDFRASTQTGCVEPTGSTDAERARTVVEAFLGMRVDGASDEVLAIALSRFGLAYWTDPDTDLAPLHGAYASLEVISVEGPLPVEPDGEPFAFHLGVRLTTDDGDEVVESIAVAPGVNLNGDPCPFVVTGGQSGSTARDLRLEV
jgi:hypothetical protein